MRRLFPLIVTVVGMAAVFSVFVNFTNPLTGNRVETKLGLDLQGGSKIEYQILPVGDQTPGVDAQRTERDIIERRVNSTGVAEPLVQTQGTDRIVVELPGVSNADDIRKLIGTTGRLASSSAATSWPRPTSTSTPPTWGPASGPSRSR